MNEMERIALQEGTDKANPHEYCRWYDQWWNRRRFEKLNILELGWGGHEDPEAGGESALLWRRYFPYSNVVVIDVEPKIVDPEKFQGVDFRQVDQADTMALWELSDAYGGFDFVVDDASHVSSLTISSLTSLWPHVRPGGVYAVEDTHSSYHDFYYGQGEANPDPDGRTSSGRPTAMQYLRRLADQVNFRGDETWDLFPPEFSKGLTGIDWLHFSFNLCGIGKKA